jgi:hypothetical protein
MDILTAALISILVVWLYSFIGETMALTDSLFAAVTELQASVAAVSARIDKLVVDLANAVTQQDVAAVTDALKAETVKLQSLVPPPSA